MNILTNYFLDFTTLYFSQSPSSGGMALGGVNSNPQDSLDTFLLWSDEPTGFSGSYGNVVASFGTSW